MCIFEILSRFVWMDATVSRKNTKTPKYSAPKLYYETVIELVKYNVKQDISIACM